MQYIKCLRKNKDCVCDDDERRKLLIPSAPGTVKILLSGEEKKIRVEV